MRLSLGELGGLNSLAVKEHRWIYTHQQVSNEYKIDTFWKIDWRKCFSRTESNCDLYKEKSVRHVGSWTEQDKDVLEWKEGQCDS